MRIIFDEEEQAGEDLLKKIEEAAKICLENEGIFENGYGSEAEENGYEDIEISLSFVSLEEIRELNRDYRQKDTVTDVLSFPQYENTDEFPRNSLLCLGDVVICLDKAKNQAEEFGHSFEREIIYLFVHSMFHLLGYDHMNEDERKVMRQKEEIVMKSLGVERYDG